MSTATEMYKKLKEFKANVIQSMPEVDELNLSCKSLLQRYLNDIESVEPAGIIKIQAIIDYMHEQVNIGNWKEVKLFLRKTITIASYLKLLAHFKCANDLTENMIKEAFKMIDFGILFGCPIDKEPKLLQDCATIIYPTYSHPVSDTNGSILDNVTEKTNIERNKYNATILEVVDRPSMEHFYQNYILKEIPVVLDNCINHWPALSKWKDQNYFIKLAGLRTVSIELGRDYTDSEWTQKLMTVEEFIKNHIYQSNGPTGYLAQYKLFEQIPELKDDIVEPDYCCFSNSQEPVDVMAWYGPKGTVSPLHHDPKRNLLAQVIGEKQIFLFSPKDSEYVYPHKHELLTNTARVDPREPNLEKYPKYKEAKVYYCVLRPGQLLYIPPKWWHFVESLSLSFSVSFWWE